MRICLCLNCLSTGAVAVSVGPDKGHQMDSYRDTLDLCKDCEIALLAGDFATLAARHTAERVINVGAQRER
jgi:hypothetical protein